MNTPNANRVHIALFGKRNSGKSSLINAITNQDIALVSDTAGTTTDPVLKAMEILPIGPCVLIDTAGFDDVGELGEMRVEATRKVLDKTDVALVLFADSDMEYETQWVKLLKERKIPILPVVSKGDTVDSNAIQKLIKKQFGLDAVITSAKEKTGMAELKEALVRLIPEDFELKSITGHITSPGDVVMLVMPQDIQAPKGRLILPQVQTIRDLLDNKCIVLSVTTENIQSALDSLKSPPKVIITDSQVFKQVYDLKPPESILTSFSVLFSNYKGDAAEFKQGAEAISKLTPQDKVLIAEACTHAPLDGDIGREKIPNLLRKTVGKDLQIDIVAGVNFPKDLSGYALIIHCGGCMFNRRYILSRVAAAKNQNVPITNYGMAIAKMTGILDKITV